MDRSKSCLLSARKLYSVGFLSLILLSRILPAQEYCWPTDASRMMTSSFGEYRSGHFHAGLDVKTWGREGYKVFAIADGSIIRVRVSPYGYGRVVYLLLDDGKKAVFAHLSRFSDRVEPFIKEEQKRRGRFAVEKVFKTGFLRVEKGDLIGFTGSSGSGVPHLHFEVRDTLNQPFNPLILDFPIEDTIPPDLKAIAVSPLSFGSHVDGDFQPKALSFRKEREGSYVLDEAVKVWGRLGLSLSAHDRANGAWNRFSLYKIRLFMDEKLVFTVQYDRFSYDRTRQVELDRDYRLNRWGWGLFQKLYLDVGNELSFYEPVSMGAGILCCWNDDERDVDSSRSFAETSEETEGHVFLGEGDHSFRIEALDYFGNFSEAVGVLRVMPLSMIQVEEFDQDFEEEQDSNAEERAPTVTLEKHLFEKYIRFCVHSDRPLMETPSLLVEINSWDKSFVSLVPRSSRKFVGAHSWAQGVDGLMITELRYFYQAGLEKVIRDSVHVFSITSDRGGSIVSPDGVCRIVFPPNTVYESILGYCQQDTSLHLEGILDWQYSFFPQDVPFKGGVKVFIDAQTYGGEKEKLGIYSIGGKGRAGFVGGEWKDGMVSAWMGSLGRLSIIQDTIVPEIRFIYPDSEVHIWDRTPEIVVGFADTLSGVSGEDNYIVRMDDTRLIVEYLPSKKIIIHQVDEPLDFGDHVLEVTIRDRAGNVAERRSRFYINP